VDSFRAFAQEHPATLPWPPSLKDFSIIGKLPVVSVSHADAERYCRWKYKDGRLPTEAEWEWAARAPDGRLYPWGSDFRKRCVNGMNGTDGVLEAPGGRPCGATAAGLLDMSGNAWEWTSSPPSLYPGSNGKLPPTTAGAFVARGGSFSNTDQDDLTGTIRVFLPGPNRFTGFRCAVGTRPAGE
jgi:formylglycine-generating enzyme required for sulfatase activity